MNILGSYIRSLRKHHGLTQMALSKLVKVDYTYISKLERGQLNYAPSQRVLERLADVFHVNANQLMVLARRVSTEWQRTLMCDPLGVKFIGVLPSLTKDERMVVEEIINNHAEKRSSE